MDLVSMLRVGARTSPGHKTEKKERKEGGSEPVI